MRKKTAFILFLTALVGLMMTACAGEAATDSESETVTRDSLETFDVENLTSVSLQLTDSVVVEADVTPYEVYRDGISSYYLIKEDDITSDDTENAKDDKNENNDSADTTGTAADMEDLTGLFGISVNTQLSLLETYFACEPDLTNLTLDIFSDGQYYLQIPDQDGEIISFHASSLNGTGSISYIRSGYDFIEWAEYLYDAYTWQIRFEEAIPEKVSSNVQKKFTDTMEFMSELTGDAISDYGRCFKLNNSDYTYGFLYYYSVDGLPLIYTEQLKEFDETATISDSVSVMYDSTQTYANEQLDQAMVFYLDGELIGMSISKSNQTGDVYKKAKVLDAKEILELAQAYYDFLEISEQLVITDVQLVYNSYFSDPNDGDVQNILSPFWYLYYYDASADNAYCNRALVFDAYTGECLGDYGFTLSYSY